MATPASASAGPEEAAPGRKNRRSRGRKGNRAGQGTGDGAANEPPAAIECKTSQQDASSSVDTDAGVAGSTPAIRNKRAKARGRARRAKKSAATEEPKTDPTTTESTSATTTLNDTTTTSSATSTTNSNTNSSTNQQQQKKKSKQKNKTFAEMALNPNLPTTSINVIPNTPQAKKANKKKEPQEGNDVAKELQPSPTTPKMKNAITTNAVYGHRWGSMDSTPSRYSLNENPNLAPRPRKWSMDSYASRSPSRSPSRTPTKSQTPAMSPRSSPSMSGSPYGSPSSRMVYKLVPVSSLPADHPLLTPPRSRSGSVCSQRSRSGSIGTTPPCTFPPKKRVSLLETGGWRFQKGRSRSRSGSMGNFRHSMGNSPKTTPRGSPNTASRAVRDKPRSGSMGVNPSNTSKTLSFATPLSKSKSKAPTTPTSAPLRLPPRGRLSSSAATSPPITSAPTATSDEVRDIVRGIVADLKAAPAKPDNNNNKKSSAEPTSPAVERTAKAKRRKRTKSKPNANSEKSTSEGKAPEEEKAPVKVEVVPQEPAKPLSAAGKLECMCMIFFCKAYGLMGVNKRPHGEVMAEAEEATGCSHRAIQGVLYTFTYDGKLGALRTQVPIYPVKADKSKARDLALKSLLAAFETTPDHPLLSYDANAEQTTA